MDTAASINGRDSDETLIHTLGCVVSSRVCRGTFCSPVLGILEALEIRGWRVLREMRQLQFPLRRILRWRGGRPYTICLGRNGCAFIRGSTVVHCIRIICIVSYVYCQCCAALPEEENPSALRCITGRKKSSSSDCALTGIDTSRSIFQIDSRVI